MVQDNRTEIDNIMLSSDGLWRGTAQELMEVLETKDVVPSHDYRRGFDACESWPDEFHEYPITQEDLLAWAVLGKEKILQAEELTRQYMVDVARITKFRFSDERIIWVKLPFVPFGTILWVSGLRFSADGHIFVDGEKYKTSGCDICLFGYRIWGLHSEGVMISY